MVLLGPSHCTWQSMCAPPSGTCTLQCATQADNSNVYCGVFGREAELADKTHLETLCQSTPAYYVGYATTYVKVRTTNTIMLALAPRCKTGWRSRSFGQASQVTTAKCIFRVYLEIPPKKVKCPVIMSTPSTSSSLDRHTNGCSIGAD